MTPRRIFHCKHLDQSCLPPRDSRLDAVVGTFECIESRCVLSDKPGCEDVCWEEREDDGAGAQDDGSPASRRVDCREALGSSYVDSFQGELIASDDYYCPTFCDGHLRGGHPVWLSFWKRDQVGPGKEVQLRIDCLSCKTCRRIFEAATWRTAS